MKTLKFSSLRILLYLFLIVNSYAINNTKEKENKNRFSYSVDLSESDLSKAKIKENQDLIDDKEALVIDSTFYQNKDKKSKISFLSRTDSNRSISKGRLVVWENYKTFISGFEQFVYEQLLNIFRSNNIPNLSFKFTNIENQNVHASNFIDKLNTGIFILREDHTEIWYLDGYDTTFQQNHNGIVTEFTIKIKTDKSLSELNEINDRIWKAALKIANAANKKPTMYEKLLYIHDYMFKHIIYDGNGKNQHNVIGGLIDHRAVCDGITKSFCLVSRLIGAETLLVSANGHAWNYVRLDNRLYAIDVTWDINLNLHAFFLIGSDTPVGDKRYKDEPIRNLDKNRYYPPKELSPTEYDPPNIDPNAAFGYKDCKNRLGNEVRVNVQSGQYFDMNEIYHLACAPSQNNKCRYHFSYPNSDRYENYKECSRNMAKGFRERGLEGRVCFFNTYFSQKEYCIQVTKKK